ncbi:cytochrome P450 [Nonomuraea sp. NPDC055795]
MSSVLDADLLSPGVLADPYAFYAGLREREPVHWSERMGCWLISRHADCVAILREPERFTADPAAAGYAMDEALASVQNLDPPRHGPLRNLLMTAYRTQNHEALARELTRRADHLAGRLVTSPRPDLIGGFLAPLAMSAVGELLGVPEDDLAELGAIAEAVVHSMDTHLDADRARAAARARGELSDLVGRLLDNARPDAPGLLGALSRDPAPAGVMPSWVRHSIRIFLSAGYTSSYATAANAFVALQEAGVPPARALGGTALNELLRYAGPVHGLARICARDGEVGGRVVRRGEIVLLLLAAANRDPARFERPEELMLDRAQNPHLALGWGPHACLGSLTAKATLSAALEAAAHRLPSLRLETPVRYRPQATVRCPERLVVTLTGAVS